MRALIPTSTNNRSSSFLDGRYDDTSSLAGGAGGVFSVILDGANAIIDGMESFAHRTWEDDAMQSGALSTGRRKHDDIDDDDDGRRRPSFPSTYYRRRRGNVPEIDMNVHVPCDVVEARKYLLEGGRTIAIDGCDDDGNDDGGLAGVTVAVDRCINRPPSPLEMAAVGASDDDVCRLRDVITRDLLVEYVRLFHDDEFDISTHPIVLRNLWPEESFREAPDVVEDENSGGRNDVGNDGGVCEQREGHGLRKKRRLSPAAIMNDPQLSNLVLPNYFSDAANRAGYAALVPDAYDDVPTTLSHFLTRILSGDSPNAKIGTQVIVDEHPELRDEIIPAYLARGVFGWNTHLEDIAIWSRGRGWLVEDIVAWMCKVLPSMSTYPVFIAGNGHRDGAMGADMDDGTPRHPRTDLHSEPIGNIASQLHGTRRWTLVPTAWSVLLRPTISRHRAYFYSNMDPYIELPERLDGIPLVYECVTRRGDTMWIPPWVSKINKQTCPSLAGGLFVRTPPNFNCAHVTSVNSALDVASRGLRRRWRCRNGSTG